MKKVIYAAKQVGEISYCVSDPVTLAKIIKSEEIWWSNNIEYNANTYKKQYSISFGRDLLAAPKRSPKKWGFGLILNGDKLSEHNKFQTYSYAGTVMGTGVGKFAIGKLTEYNDGTYAMSIVKWRTVEITKKLYDYFLSQLNSISDKYQIKLKHGSRKNNEGKMIKDQYTIGSMYGDSGTLIRDAPEWVRAEISNLAGVHETEERIWNEDFKFNKSYKLKKGEDSIPRPDTNLDISGCIIGIILPKPKDKDQEADEQYLIDLANQHTLNPAKILYY